LVLGDARDDDPAGTLRLNRQPEDRAPPCAGAPARHLPGGGLPAARTGRPPGRARCLRTA
ncbi:hypothetical protein ACWDPI_18650, partial [Streptomyces zhihengii]